MKIRMETDMSVMDMMQDSFYRQVDPRRRQEIYESRLVREDQKAMANLPRQAINHEYDQDRFKHDSMSAGSSNWSHNEVGFVRHNQKGFVGRFEDEE